MSKLEKMIKELCPDGVEYVKVGSFTSYYQPSKYIVESTEYSDEYKTPVLTPGQTFILGYTNEVKNIFKGSEHPIILFDDFTCACRYINFDFKVKSSAVKFIYSNDEEKLMTKFIYYWLESLNYKTDSSNHKRY